VSFVVRPLGGVYFGQLADRIGRRPAFVASLLTMAAAMALIALVPSASVIGVAAPAVLVLARLAQGLSAGGEMPTGTAFLAEAVPAARRGWYTSFIYVGVGVGTLAASVLGAVLAVALTEAQLATWGWRVAFGVGALLCLYGLWVRARLPETEVFEASKASRDPAAQPTLRELLRRHPRAVLQVVLLISGSTAGYYTFGSYLPAYLHTTIKFSSTTSFLISSVVLVAYTLTMPLAGWLTDRFGRRPVMAVGALGLAVVTVPVSLLLPHVSPLAATVLLCPPLILLAMRSGPGPTVMSELFPTRVRALGIGVGYSLSTALFGGTAPYLATWLASIGAEGVNFGWVILLSLVSAAVLLTISETAGTQLRDQN
jgi:MHS family alpha-ketoglutarate permease-like MFS transporter